MSFAGGKRIVYSSMVVILIMLVLQIWVCCDCQVGAIRIFPGTGMAKVMKESNISAAAASYKKGFTGDLLHKYFSGRAFNFNRTGKGFEDNKRRVPSCPDPLHN